jgi:protein ImuA
LTLSCLCERTKIEQNEKPVMRMEPMHRLVAGGFITSQSDKSDNPARVMEALRGHIARLEKALPQLDKDRSRSLPWTFGVADIDAHLAAQGLARYGLHDVSPRDYGEVPAAMRVTLALALRRLGDASERRPLLWCRLAREVREYGNLYGHGVEFMGLPRHRFVTVTLKRPVDVLWVAEEALKSGAVSVVITDADARHTSLTATRRLSLAAQAGKSSGLMVFTTPQSGATASHTRWIAAAARSQPPPYDAQAPGLVAWNLELVRARGGRPGAWVVEWQDAPHRFNLVSKLRSGEIHAGAEEAGQSIATEGRSLRTG